MKLPDIATAVRMYYEKPELSPADIRELFGCCGATAQKLKKQAQAAMVVEGVTTWSAMNVNTRVAYKTWGINISDYEERLKGISRLNKLEAAIKSAGGIGK